MNGEEFTHLIEDLPLCACKTNNNSLLSVAGGASQSRNFRMYGSETSTLHDRRLLWRNRVSSGFVFSHELTRGTLIRLLEFTNPSILAICELKLIEGGKHFT